MVERTLTLQEAAVVAMGTLAVLPQAPKTDAEVKQVAQLWVAMFQRNGLTGDDLAAAVPECLDTEKYFPKAPAVLIECARRAIEKRRWDAYCDRLEANSNLLSLPVKSLPLSQRPPEEREQIMLIREQARRKLGIDSDEPPSRQEPRPKGTPLASRLEQFRQEFQAHQKPKDAV